MPSRRSTHGAHRRALTSSCCIASSGAEPPARLSSHGLSRSTGSPVAAPRPHTSAVLPTPDGPHSSTREMLQPDGALAPPERACASKIARNIAPASPCIESTSSIAAASTLPSASAGSPPHGSGGGTTRTRVAGPTTPQSASDTVLAADASPEGVERHTTSHSASAPRPPPSATRARHGTSAHAHRQSGRHGCVTWSRSPLSAERTSTAEGSLTPAAPPAGGGSATGRLIWSCCQHCTAAALTRSPLPASDDDPAAPSAANVASSTTTSSLSAPTTSLASAPPGRSAVVSHTKSHGVAWRAWSTRTETRALCGARLSPPASVTSSGTPDASICGARGPCQAMWAVSRQRFSFHFSIFPHTTSPCLGHERVVYVEHGARAGPTQTSAHEYTTHTSRLLMCAVSREPPPPPAPSS